MLDIHSWNKVRPSPRSGQSLNGIILVNSTSGRMDQERFIAIKRARGVLEYVKRLLREPSPSINGMDASLKWTGVREFL